MVPGTLNTKVEGGGGGHKFCIIDKEVYIAQIMTFAKSLSKTHEFINTNLYNFERIVWINVKSFWVYGSVAKLNTFFTSNIHGWEH
jgi:hypothetical protein